MSEPINPPETETTPADKAKIAAALNSLAYLQSQVDAAEKKPEPLKAEVQQRDPIKVQPFVLGIRATDKDEWDDMGLPPSRYVVAARLSMFNESIPNDQVWCSDVPEGTPGCSKENPSTVSKLFDLYTAGEHCLLMRNVEPTIQAMVLELFNKSPVISMAVTFTEFAPNGQVSVSSVGYENPWTSLDEVKKISNKLLLKATEALAAKLGQAGDSGLILPKNPGQIIIPS